MRAVALLSLALLATVAVASSGPFDSLPPNARNTVKARDAAASAAADVWWFHLGNCVSDEMTFVSCDYVVGDFVVAPGNISKNANMSFAIAETASGTTGNCTWTYNNTHGQWGAFFDWNVIRLGDQDFGAGTADEIDNENTDLTTPFFNIVCTVFAYGIDGTNFCIAQTSPPADGCMQWGHNKGSGARYAVNYSQVAQNTQLITVE